MMFSEKNWKLDFSENIMASHVANQMKCTRTSKFVRTSTVLANINYTSKKKKKPCSVVCRVQYNLAPDLPCGRTERGRGREADRQREIHRSGRDEQRTRLLSKSIGSVPVAGFPAE